MARPVFRITYTEPRNRFTNLFRYILALPHLVVSAGWLIFAEVLAVGQWFVVLFTGNRNERIWTMQNDYLGYAARVHSYSMLMYDKWPNLGPEPDGEPTSYSFQYAARASRLTSFARLLLIIPAVMIAIAAIAGLVVAVLCCAFAIRLRGKQPRGLFDFMAQAISYLVQVTAYWMLMTDDYPRFGA